VTLVELAVEDNGIPPLRDTLTFELVVKIGNTAPYFVTTRLDTALVAREYRADPCQ